MRFFDDSNSSGRVHNIGAHKSAKKFVMTVEAYTRYAQTA